MKRNTHYLNPGILDFAWLSTRVPDDVRLPEWEPNPDWRGTWDFDVEDIVGEVFDCGAEQDGHTCSLPTDHSGPHECWSFWYSLNRWIRCSIFEETP